MAGSLGGDGSTEHVHAADVVQGVRHAVGDVNTYRLIERQRATLEREFNKGRRR